MMDATQLVKIDPVRKTGEATQQGDHLRGASLYSTNQENQTGQFWLLFMIRITIQPRLINCYIMDIVATQRFCKKLAVLLFSSLFSDLTFNFKSMCYTKQMCYVQRILTCIHHRSCQLEGNAQKF